MDKYNNKFIPPQGDLEMKKHLNIDNIRIQKMLDIKLRVFNKENEIKANTKNMNSEKTTKTTTDILIDIDSKTVIGEVIGQYPFIKDFLVSLSPDYNRLTNPVLFKTMKNIATLDMISKVGGFKVDHLIKLIKQEIEDKQ